MDGKRTCIPWYQFKNLPHVLNKKPNLSVQVPVPLSPACVPLGLHQDPEASCTALLRLLRVQLIVYIDDVLILLNLVRFRIMQ